MANMSFKVESYQSVGLSSSFSEDDTGLAAEKRRNHDHDNGCVVAEVGSSLNNTMSAAGYQRTNTKRRRRVIGAAVFLMAALSVIYLTVRLTETEREIAAANSLPESFATKRKIRSADTLAKETRTNILSGLDDLDFGAVMKRAGFLGSIPAGVKEVVVEEEHEDENQHLAPEGCEATIIILRHCEKGSIREHCNYVGYERSVYLATLFGDDIRERWPAPSYIFALGPGGRQHKYRMNFREIETVGPLSEKVGVPVDYSYNVNHENKLAKQLLKLVREGDLCGKLALVAWKHSLIGHLAHHLGCGPNEGCPLDYKGNTFDNAWQIKFVYREFDHSVQKDLEVDPKPEWRVFGSVQPEGFDPLAFSKIVGDYSRPASLGKQQQQEQIQPGWQLQAAEIAERKDDRDTDDWFKVPNSTNGQHMNFLGIPHAV